MMPVLSRSLANKLIQDGVVAVNGVTVLKSGHKLKPDDAVTIDYDPEQAFEIPDITLPVIFEDDDCVVIEKPIGLLTHSKGAFNPEPSVATWLHNKITDKHLVAVDEHAPNRRAGIVHRLDRGTSGLLIAAKTGSGLQWLQKQFSSRKVKKTYYAVVQGVFKDAEAVIDIPIERNPKMPSRFRVGVNGKPAITRYHVVQENNGLSLVALYPETGRTHQLRVHMAHLGHPILGDDFYDGKPADRLYLHATELEITIPSRERKVFHAPIPESFGRVVDGD